MISSPLRDDKRKLEMDLDTENAKSARARAHTHIRAYRGVGTTNSSYFLAFLRQITAVVFKLHRAMWVTIMGQMGHAGHSLNR